MAVPRSEAQLVGVCRQVRQHLVPVLVSLALVLALALCLVLAMALG